MTVIRMLVGIFLFLALASFGCTADVSGPNRAPVARAGADLLAELDQTVQLDGSGSYDPDHDPLTFQFRLLAAPAGSTAELSTAGQTGLLEHQAQLTPDQAGDWLIGLTVFDGRMHSQRDVVRVMVRGRPCVQDADCDNSQWCDGSERCIDGLCASGEPADCSHMQTACAQASCDEQADLCTSTPLPAGTTCDDGAFCTVDEVCDNAGLCQGTARECPSDDPCLQGVCNEAGGACTLIPLAEGAPCDDGLFCKQAETCQSGVCQGGSPRDCSASGTGCVDGTCDEEQDDCIGENLPDGTGCDDESACTTDEACLAGQCTGTPTDCSHLAGPCSQGVCDPADGTCQAVPANDGMVCDDANACSSSDRCQEGSCTGTPVDCSYLDGPCSQGACDPMTGTCQVEPASEGSPCDDELFCTDGDSCVAGSCQGSAKVCPGDSGDTCQQPTCDEDSDQCLITAAPDGSVCDDGNACTNDEICTGGVCLGTEDCALGCNQGAGRCYQLDPSNLDPDRLCPTGAPDLLLPSNTVVVVDTDAGTIAGQTVATFVTVDQGGGLHELAIFSFHEIQIPGDTLLQVQGDRGLALVACSQVIIQGRIEAKASGQAGGAGGFDGGDGSRYQGQVSPEKGHGPGGGGGGSMEYGYPYRQAAGGGGGFGRLGGNGGMATGPGGYSDHAGGAGGSIDANAALSPIEGGAGGGGGGSYNLGGNGGGGGGAIQISAGSSISIGPAGGIDVAGAGGRLASTGNYGAGGGGGAGGAILLEAPNVTVEGILAANGGGGAGGRTDYPYDDQDCPPNTPQPGGDGPFGDQRGAGGVACYADSGAPSAGDGGPGGAMDGPMGAGSGGQDARASGAGAGGCGQIRINSLDGAGASLTGTTSPTCPPTNGETSCSTGAISLW